MNPSVESSSLQPPLQPQNAATAIDLIQQQQQQQQQQQAPLEPVLPQVLPNNPSSLPLSHNPLGMLSTINNLYSNNTNTLTAAALGRPQHQSTQQQQNTTNQVAGAQAAALFLQQYLDSFTTAQQQQWQLQQAIQQQQTPQQIVSHPSLVHGQLNPSSMLQMGSLPPAPALGAHLHLQQQQQQDTSNFSSLTSKSMLMPTATKSGRKRKADDTNNVLQFSDEASRSLLLDHSRPQQQQQPMTSSSSVNSMTDVPPPKEKSATELSRLTPAERRRYDRNLREQQRSYRISQQIKTLREVLTESNVPFKPNKFSILVSVSDYIKNLQQRSVLLDVEQTKLADTIRRTSELVQSGQVPNNSDDDEKDSHVTNQAETQDQRDRSFVQGLDYKAVFQFSPFASGVASLDGRILYANMGLEQCFGSNAAEMEQQSLFLYIRNHQDVFEAMADILRRSSEETGEESGARQSLDLLYWCGQVTSHRNEQLQLNITLACSGDGNPRYFCFSTVPVE